MNKVFSIVNKLSAKRFADHHSDWPNLLGTKPLVRGHRNFKCILPHTPTVGKQDQGHHLKFVLFNCTKLGIKVQ